MSAIPRETSKSKFVTKETDGGHAFAGIFIPTAQCYTFRATFFNVLERDNEAINPAQGARQRSLVRELLHSIRDLTPGSRRNRRFALPGGDQPPSCGIHAGETDSHMRR